EKPDIVIQEVVERSFAQCMPWSVEDWRTWIVRTLSANGGAKAGWLTILPETTDINLIRFFRVKLPDTCTFRTTSVRRWSPTGEKVVFSEKDALYSDWYLLKTGIQGVALVDQDSEQAYQKLNEFVRNSGHFKEISQLPMPDGNHLSLYKQVAETR